MNKKTQLLAALIVSDPSGTKIQAFKLARKPSYKPKSDYILNRIPGKGIYCDAVSSFIKF